MTVRPAPLSVTLAILALLVALPAVAGAQTATGSAIDEAAAALERDPVHVDPAAENAISDAEAGALRDRIRDAGAGPVYVAILPEAASDEAGGDPAALGRAIANRLRRRGTYAVIAGDSFRAASTELDRGVAGALAEQAISRQGDAGAAATLGEFVDLVAEARRNDGEAPSTNEPGGGGLGALGLLAIVGGGFGFVAWRRARRRRRELEAEVVELRETARDDLVALGDDVRALDLDVQMPGADEQAKTHYAEALERYERAERLLDRAGRPEDFAPIGQALEEGRYAMAAAKARFEGRAIPERRPPCFFDPRHGPSTRDVLWAPDGYEARPVPVCEADAVRIEEGAEPMTREILAGGRRVPLYDAPGFYGPYAGGFFGGFTGFLPGLLFGSMLGTGLGAFGGMGAGDAYGGDLGGGDFSGGDFGGGGPDFGGGDFGGGDFGGGDF